MSKHPLIRLVKYSRKERNRIIWGIICSIVNKLLDLAPPVLIGMAVDIVVSQENSFISNFGIISVENQLWSLAGLTLLIWFLESITDYISSLLWRNTAQSIQHDLRVNAFTHLINLELEYFENRRSGDLITVLNDDVNQLERFLDSGVHEIIKLITTVIAVGALFIAIVPGVSWMALLPMPFIAAGSIYFQKFLVPMYSSVREQAGVLSTRLVNALGGIVTVKSFNAERHESERITSSSLDYAQFNRRAIRLSSAFVPLIRMVIVLGFTAILVFGGKLVISGNLNVGAYSILIFMTQRLLWPFTTLGTTLDLYQRAMASTTRILDVITKSPTIVGGDEELVSESVAGGIKFLGVSFTYNTTQPVIENISFAIQAGQSVGFVGATGSGKTTLIKLLLRFYDTQSGKILLDGHDIRSLKFETLRNAISLVTQDVFLIDGSVKENISYGNFNAAEEEIINAAKIAEAHEFIEQLPNSYETLVGERGQKLSGGQRQRISIARAILKNSPILILDEATSSVDNETEAAIQRAIYKASQDRTMIIIAHRLSTVRHVDVIFVMERGVIAEKGTHEELLDKDSYYASLWKMQTGEIDAPLLRV